MRKKIIILLNLFAITMLFQAGTAFGQTIKESVYFENDRFELQHSGKDKIDSIMTIVDRYKYGCQVKIYGHADSSASVSYNMKLSEKRANAVSSYFKSKGLDRSCILIKFFGENRPIALGSAYGELGKNRRVDIIVSFEKPAFSDKQVDLGEDEEDDELTGFEHDVIVFCENGGQLLIEAGAFYPHKLSDIDFNIKEYYSKCDMLNSNITMQTDSGDCLTSGGMMIIKPMIDTLEIQPNKGKKIRVRIPAYNNVIDKEMDFYVAGQVDNLTKWKKKKIKIEHYEESGINYYEVELDNLTGINIDKPIKIRCEDNGPIVKVRSFKNIEMYLTYPNEMYLSDGIHLKNRIYSLAKLNKEKEPVLTVVAEKNGFNYVATGPILDLKYKKKKNMYIVKSSYFFVPKSGYSREESPAEEVLCNVFSRQD